jgi:phage baseplate assembly protein W
MLIEQSSFSGGVVAMQRQDYSFPFRLDGQSRQALQSVSYQKHVEDMVVQVLLTAPGERIDVPEFGCGVRKLLFAPNSDALAATAQVTIQQALNRWLGDQITVSNVAVTPPENTPDQSQLLILIQYVLIETQSAQGLEILVQ